MDFLSQLNIRIPVTVNMLTAVLLLLFVVWLIHMIILRYHWSKFGYGKLLIVRMNLIYFIGSAIIFSSMIGFFILYILS